MSNSKKVLKASTSFLERQGYEILSSKEDLCENECEVIALNQEEELTFIKVNLRDMNFPSTDVDRSFFENCLINWTIDHPTSVDMYENGPVRFDVIDVIITSEDRAILRHHINALAKD